MRSMLHLVNYHHSRERSVRSMLHLVNRLALNSVVLGRPVASQLGHSRSGVTTSCDNSVYGVPSGD